METNAPVTPTSGGNPVQDKATGPARRPKGPNTPTIIFGLVALVLGTLIIAAETNTWHIDWSGLGPGAIVVIGFLLVVIGAIGLVRRHDDV